VNLATATVWGNGESDLDSEKIEEVYYCGSEYMDEG